MKKKFWLTLYNLGVSILFLLSLYSYAKGMAGFPLHGNIGFILFIMVYLLIGRNTIQAPDPVSNQQIINSIIRGNLTDAIRRFTWYAVRDHTRFIHINLSSQEKMCGMRWQIDISAMKFSRYSRSALSGACDIWLWISRERLLSGDKNLSSRMHEWPVAEAWKGGHAPARATMGFRLFCLP